LAKVRAMWDRRWNMAGANQEQKGKVVCTSSKVRHSRHYPHPFGPLMGMVCAALLGHACRGLEQILSAARVDRHNLGPD
jgi:hypothetical protein